MMATKKPAAAAPAQRLRDLHPNIRREVDRARAGIAVEKVKISDAKARIEEHQANIDKLKGNNGD